jgi:hypothetical protein
LDAYQQPSGKGRRGGDLHVLARASDTLNGSLQNADFARYVWERSPGTSSDVPERADAVGAPHIRGPEAVRERGRRRVNAGSGSVGGSGRLGRHDPGLIGADPQPPAQPQPTPKGKQKPHSRRRRDGLRSRTLHSWPWKLPSDIA